MVSKLISYNLLLHNDPAYSKMPFGPHHLWLSCIYPHSGLWRENSRNGQTDWKVPLLWVTDRAHFRSKDQD